MRILLSILFLILIISSAQAVFYHDEKPEYVDSDFIKPEKMIEMEQLEIYQLTVIIAMLIVTSLKVFGTYLLLRSTNKDLRFNPAFAVSGVLGTFVGYQLFMAAGFPQDTTIINLFMIAGSFALGSNLLFDFAGKVKNKVTE